MERAYQNQKTEIAQKFFKAHKKIDKASFLNILETLTQTSFIENDQNDDDNKLS